LLKYFEGGLERSTSMVAGPLGVSLSKSRARPGDNLSISKSQN
jgi:hypothetical protein